MIKPLKLIVICTIVLLFSACSGEFSSPDNNSGKVKVNFSLTDAPADYVTVLVDIQEIRIKQPSIDTGWVAVENVEGGIFDLLQLQNGIDTLLGTTELDTGKLSQIRLILGSENSLITTEDTFTLTTPSAEQSGLKIQVNETLVSDSAYHILLDFDAEKSVHKAGNSGKYMLKPTIKATITSTQE